MILDPNKALNRLRELAAINSFEGVDIDYTFEEMQEHFKALDEWLSRGGFVPDEWQYMSCQHPDHRKIS